MILILQEREVRHHDPASPLRNSPQRTAMVIQIEKVIRQIDGYLNMNLFMQSISCLDRALSKSPSLSLKKGFPVSCFLLQSKFHETESPSISSLAEFCGVTVEELTSTEREVFACVGMDLYAVTVYDYMELLFHSLPEEHIKETIRKTMDTVYQIPSTRFLPSVVAAAILDNVLGSPVEGGILQFFTSMETKADSVTECGDLLAKLDPLFAF